MPQRTLGSAKGGKDLLLSRLFEAILWDGRFKLARHHFFDDRSQPTGLGKSRFERGRQTVEIAPWANNARERVFGLYQVCI